MPSDLVDRLRGVKSSQAIKVPCRVATTANITLSGEQTIDGVAVVDGDRVLVKDQSTASENGIYQVKTSAWLRAPDWDGSGDIVKGTSVYVTDGTAGAGRWVVSTANPITIGTTSVAFSGGASTESFLPAGDDAVLRTVQAKLREWVSLEDFGVVPGLSVSDAVAEANVTNAQAALDYAGVTGARIIAPGQYYVFKDEGLRLPTGVHVYGNGVDYWEPIFPQNPKGWAGTNFIAKGLSGAATKYTVTGITSMRYAGGRREDPGNPGEYFELTSLMEDDASGTTPATAKQLSVFVTGKDDAVNWGLHGIRIVPWLGTDGVSDYSNESNAALSHPWDVGLLLDDHEGVDISDVQSVGHWRVWGCAVISPGLSDFGHSERNSIRRCRFQGLTGFALRGGDQWAVSAKTSSTVTIRWSEESYWPSGAGGFEAVGNGTADYTYTGTTRVGDDLRFDGVSPDPDAAGVFQIRNPNDGTGLAGTQIQDVICHGLDHESGDDAEAMGLAISKAFEMSGSPMRGVQAFNFKCHTSERVIAYLHDVQDFLSFGWQVEGTGHILASPATTDSSATAPVGDTRNLRIYAGIGFVDVQDDLWNPRSQYRDGDQINPRDENEAHFLFKALSGQDAVFELATGKSFKLRNDDESVLLQFDEATGLLTITGSINNSGAYVGSSDIRAGQNSPIYWSNRAQLRSPADGQVNARNFANDAYATVGVATPTSDEHATTKFYVDAGWRRIGGSHAAVSRSSVNGAGDATETTIATVTIPANRIGPNGSVKVTCVWSFAGGTSGKTVRWRLNGLSGTQYYTSGSVTTSLSARDERMVGNRNSASSQIGGTSGAGYANSASAVATSSIDTTAAVDIVFTTAWAGATSGETITLESYLVEVMYGA